MTMTIGESVERFEDPNRAPSANIKVISLKIEIPSFLPSLSELLDAMWIILFFEYLTDQLDQVLLNNVVRAHIQIRGKRLITLSLLRVFLVLAEADVSELLFLRPVYYFIFKRKFFLEGRLGLI